MPYPPGTARAAGSGLLIRMLVAVPLTLIGGLILLVISVLPVAAFDDELSTDAENWIPIVIFAGLVTVATLVARMITRDWVPLDLPAWALMFTVLPVLDELTKPWPYEGLVYVVLIGLIGLGTLARLIAFHIFAHRRAVAKGG